MRSVYIRPSLRWPGNKFSLLKELMPLFPLSFNNYHEPFLGSASVFLNTQCLQDVYLSDNNKDLINFYLQIKDNLKAFIEITHKKENTKSYYDVEKSIIYNIPIEKAAQFYYLNRTCFNGIYRVNSLGKFNVPYGHRENLKVVDESSLSILCNKLKNANIIHGDFYNSLEYIKPNDFVFLDPPYSAKKQSNKFNMYNDKLFIWSDQLRLKDYCAKLNKVGAKLMLANLYNDDIYQLFAKDLGLNCFFTERYSSIGSKVNSRGKYNEYFFCNYM